MDLDDGKEWSLVKEEDDRWPRHNLGLPRLMLDTRR